MLAFAFDSLDSTNTRARQLALLNPGRPLVVSARTQTAGRGRGARPWQSPEGGAWFSLVWPLAAGVPLARFQPAPLLAGLAVLQAIQPELGAGVPARALPQGRLAPADPPPVAPGDAGQSEAGAPILRLKWPNDVLVDGHKVAGILCEQVLPPAGAPCLILGIGINANFSLDRLPSDLRFPATTLQTVLGRAIDRRGLIQRCLAHVVPLLQDLAHQGLSPAVRQALEADLAWRGRQVALRQGEIVRQGVCRGVDAWGRLVLESAGQWQAFDAGEVDQVRVRSLPAAVMTGVREL